MSRQNLAHSGTASVKRKKSVQLEWVSEMSSTDGCRAMKSTGTARNMRACFSVQSQLSDGRVALCLSLIAGQLQDSLEAQSRRS